MKIAIFDTETDALITNSLKRLDLQPRILEIFILCGDQTGHSFDEKTAGHSYFSYPRSVPAEVTKITGITNDDLVGAPAFERRAAQFRRMLEGADRVVAHNASYDISVFNAELERLGQEPLQLKEVICTVEQSEWVKGHRLKLMDLHVELLGEEFEKAHTAENDVRATKRCYMEMVKRGWV